MKTLKQYILEESKDRKYVDIFVTYNNKTLFLRRANYIKQFGGKWCLPGGTLENDENPKSGIIRELKEETGIVVDDVKLWKNWKYSDNSTTSIYEIELDREPNIKISREHAQYKWLSIDDLPKYREKMAGSLWEAISDKFSI